MPPIIKIKKEDILNIAYQIAREEGIEKINARYVAKKLNCSIQPIFYNFKTMEELKKEVMDKIICTYKSYVYGSLDKNKPYKQMGLGYIEFAKKEPILFQTIFMSKNDSDIKTFLESDGNIELIKECVGNTTKLNNDDIGKFHTKMWIFTHGIASLIATNTCTFTDEEIDDLLTNQFNALLKQERKK